MPTGLPGHAGHVEWNARVALARGASPRQRTATCAAAFAGPVAATHRLIPAGAQAPAMAAHSTYDPACAIDAPVAGCTARICKGINP
ncbi:hypothetical protein G6F40_014173 [Rhizopus arrhizus]|nr:hypothetical protein G6F40_014173 [Rhizopus arrhizus]